MTYDEIVAKESDDLFKRNAQNEILLSTGETGTELGTRVGKEVQANALKEAFNQFAVATDRRTATVLADLHKEQTRSPEAGSRYNATGQNGGISLQDVIGGLSGKTYSDPLEARLDVKKAVRDFKALNPGESEATYSDIETVAGKHLTEKVEGSDELRAKFGTALRKEREDKLVRDTRNKAEQLARTKLSEVTEGIGMALNDVDEDPDAFPDIIQSWSDEFTLRARNAGMEEGDINKEVRRGIKRILNTSLDAQIRNDPYEALAFMEENAGLIGKDVIKYKNKARSAVNAVEREIKRDEKNKIKAELPFNVEALANLTSSKDTNVRDAAIKRQNDIVRNPIKAGIESGTISGIIGNLKNPEELEQRELDLDSASETLGKPIPFLDPSETKRLVAGTADPFKARTFLDSTDKLEDGTRDNIANQLNGDALGWALRVGNENSDLQNAILQGRASVLQPGEEEPSFSFQSDPPFRSKESEIANGQAASAIKALMRGGQSESEARGAVLNEQTVGGFLGFFGQKIPLPLNTSDEQFETTANRLFGDAKALKTYSNGDPSKARSISGDLITFEEDDIEWVPLNYGLYGINVDGVPVVTDDGQTRFQVDMEAAVHGK